MREYSRHEWQVAPGPPDEWRRWFEDDARGSSDIPGNSPTPAVQPSTDHATPKRVLVVDDEQLIADTLARILNLSGFVAHAVYSGDAALEVVLSLCPHIVLSDIRMPGRNGIETGILIREQCPQTQVVLLSGQAGIAEMMERARNAGHPFELWSKPIHPRDLIKRLREM